ncbi:MAG: hypothetical protein WC835_02270 [Candidatus Paceibacterota bacterium]|jgi:hypothetical protein
MPANIVVALLLLVLLVVLLLLRTLVNFVEECCDFNEDSSPPRESFPRMVRKFFRMETVHQAGEILVAFIVAFPAIISGLRLRFSKKK